MKSKMNTVLKALFASVLALSALIQADEQYDEIMDFLLENQPWWDVGVVTRDAMNETVAYSLFAREQLPQLSQHVDFDRFKTYATPYACLDEARDNWRRWMYEYVRPFVPDTIQTGQVSSAIFSILNDAFETKGIKFLSDLAPVRMTPFETSVWGRASCTGMSIFAASVLKSIGWPARVTGTIWNNGNPFNPGDMAYDNHNWIEVYDPDNGGVWSYLNAAGGHFTEWNKSWFNQDVCNQIANSSNYSITSAVWSFDDSMPEEWNVALPWNLENKKIPAVDVTVSYQEWNGCNNDDASSALSDFHLDWTLILSISLSSSLFFHVL